MAGRVDIVEVGPRDGLQNEKGAIDTPSKLRLIEQLTQAGLRRIEATAFVSPKWVPQMADHDAVMRGIPKRPDVFYSALVPNEKGAQAAIQAGAQALAVFASASETFARRNTNCTIAESIQRFVPVLALADAAGLPVRGYVSCATDCPYEGEIAPDAVLTIARLLRQIGCNEIAVADTLGRGTPARVRAMLQTVLSDVPAHSIACHFHDTGGVALENVDVALDLGVRIFDSAAGGLGGCPYAPGAAGNLRTGLLVQHLTGRGFDLGLDLDRLAVAEDFARQLQTSANAIYR
ncbi:hydroxymethylglutaryl-CoA lyase [Mesorhizobium sp. RP14(2022)]|uniref:Hydroxymethylglutaryl-CoA lyase n=1 Tax=Mesorhizobium liriopis TaxID=2953882 RepID=A0ABT1CBJ3_9HYPH|nr:hydroxymethylglutaryl-CoA lyase [Mesorhizobium liriopis]